MPNNHTQISIRELMVIILFVAAGLGSLLAGGLLASALIGIAAILLSCRSAATLNHRFSGD